MSSRGPSEIMPQHKTPIQVKTLWVALSFLLLLTLHPGSTEARSSSNHWPVAGIFGLGGKKDDDNNSIQKPPPPPRQQQQQQQPPPFPPGSGQRFSAGFGRPATASVPNALHPRNAAHPKRRPPPPPPTSTSSSTTTTTQEETLPGDNQTSTATTTTQDGRTDATMPPPPPPPPAQTSAARTQPSQEEEPLPPETPSWNTATPYHNSGWVEPPPDSLWQPQAPPPQEYYAQHQPQQQQQQDLMHLRQQLDESYAREHDLWDQLDNTTAILVQMEQVEALHLRQLDVLTERVMDVEAQAASERNGLAEVQANCTTLELQVGTLQGELKEWQLQCQQLEEQQDEKEEQVQELKRLIQEKTMAAEELAMAMEHIRLAEERREASQLRRTPSRGGGLISWLFGWVWGSGSRRDDDYEEMTREEAYDMAKSTLLRALQSERSNVHELETIVASLQQNNSAISEMVESRDTIIDELNNRIAVFEEDKVVLKAALKQLQKEIKDEAPKAEKLTKALSKANNEIKKLQTDIHSILQTHQQEVLSLQQNISTKQQAISDTESNLTAIGTYVDKLEERLTSFAITRRDMEERERKCKEVEEAALVTESERDALQVRVEEYTKEQEELKKLLEELASERAALQKDNRKLYTEREFRISEQEQLQERCTSLEGETKALSTQVYEWKSKVDGLTPELDAANRDNMQLQSQVATMGQLQEELQAIRSKSAAIQAQYEQTHTELLAVKGENERLEGRARNITAELQRFQREKAEAEKSRAAASASRRPAQTPSNRKVPLRNIRKELSKRTGLHGIVTPSTKMMLAEKQKSHFLKPRQQTPPPQSSQSTEKPITEEEGPSSLETLPDPPSLQDPPPPRPNPPPPLPQAGT